MNSTAASIQTTMNYTETLKYTFYQAVTGSCDLAITVINLALILIIIRRQVAHSFRGKVVQSLVVNLALLSILVTIITHFNKSTKQVHLINVPGLRCSLVSFLQSVISTAFLVNLVLIIYTKLRSFIPIFRGENMGASKNILFVWLSSALFSVPTAFMEIANGRYFEEGRETECKPVHLWGRWEATIFYETIRFLLHVGVGVYMLYAVTKIRSKLQYWITHGNLQNKRLQIKIDNIRLLYLYLLSLIFVVIPQGIMIFYRRVALRVNTENHFFEVFETILGPALLLYFYISPLLLYMLLMEFSFLEFICFCCKTRVVVDNAEQRGTSVMTTCDQASEYEFANLTDKPSTGQNEASTNDTQGITPRLQNVQQETAV